MARSKPLPRALRYISQEINRGQLLRRDKDDVKNITATIKDFDSAIMYYFSEVIKPTVQEQGEMVKVPIFYGNPERWKAARADGFVRDKSGQILTPLILFKRQTVTRDDQVTVDKLDATKPSIFQTFKSKYSNVNRYDQFSKEQGLQPQAEIFRVSMPDFVQMTYQAQIWTSYTEQMNSLIEQINYSDGSYWGEPGKFKFRVVVDSFDDGSEVGTEERVIKTTFNFNFRGYLLPERFNDELTTKRYLTPKRLVFSTETADLPTPTGYSELDLSKTTHSRRSPIVVGRGFDVQRPYSQFDPNQPGTGSVVSALQAGTTEIRISTSNQLTLMAGTGVTISNTGVGWDGANNLEQLISIGQAVATSSNVTFASVSASSAHIDGITYADSGIHGNLKVSGSLTTTGNASIAGDLIVSGTLTAQEIHTEFVSASVMFSSGSTKFGDTLDDTHTFTGSVALTGSLVLNGYSVTEISNDATLADNSATALVTENAVSNYTSTVINTEQTYLRKSYVKTSTSISATTASFTAVTASAPVTMTGTTEDDFIFFINGQYMEHDALTIRQAGSTFQLHVDTGSIGYVLESDDEIFAYGKFNS
jgi:hypothetical protein|tara:strand:- start:1445 stop:3217 length:1773 start_codon:yes stop_codon:yes gene_type:complete